MEISSFECKNCGMNLQATPDQEFVKCPACRTTHQIEHSADGSVHVTMLKEVRDAVGRVETTTTGMATVQRAMADRENAKVELEETREEYHVTFSPLRDQKTRAAKASRGGALKMAFLGVLGAIIGLALFGVHGGVATFVTLIGVLLVVIGVKTFKSAGATLSDFEKKDQHYQSRMADLLARSRRKIEI